MPRVPILTALVLCEEIERDEGDDGPTLHRVIRRYKVPALPWLVQRLAVYTMLTEAQGRYTIRAECNYLGNHYPTIWAHESEIELKDLLGSLESEFTLPPLLFEYPGRYEVRMYANGKSLGSTWFCLLADRESSEETGN